MDNLHSAFPIDSQEILSFREKRLEESKKTPFPRFGKLKTAELNLDTFNTRYFRRDTNNLLDTDLLRYIDDTDNILVMKDGNIIYKNLNTQCNSLEISSYFDALASHDDELLSIFQNHFKNEINNRLTLLNSALQNSALLVTVPADVYIKDPLKIYIFGEAGDLVHHTYISARQNSRLSVIETIVELNGVKVNFVSDTFVGDNASVNYVAIDNISSGAFIERNGSVAENGTLIYALGQLNEGNTASFNNVRLLGKNAYAETRSVYLTEGTNTHAVKIHFEHFAPHTTGLMTNHGIVKDEGVLYIEGTGKINAKMEGAKSDQKTKIIVLSDEAKAEVHPILLIDEYDVLAGHGAGIGRIDEEELYYMMSRGLSKNDAQKLVIIGFLSPLVELISSDAVKNRFLQAIENRLS